MDDFDNLWGYIHADNVEDSKLFSMDPYLSPGIGKYKEIRNKLNNQLEIIGGTRQSLDQFSKGYSYYGFNFDKEKQIYTFREWLPGAFEVYLTGDFNSWNPTGLPLTKNAFGVWEIFFEADSFPFMEGCNYKLYIKNSIDQYVYRNPAYTERVVQDHTLNLFNSVYVQKKTFEWKYDRPKNIQALKIYECHIGLSSEKGKVADFNHFTTEILPRIKNLGYNAIQVMAVAEHAYYGSFGYHVTNFFAVSSRFGTNLEFKQLIDEAHKLNILVFMDLVHSHASSNALDGLGDMDGTNHQYFHSGPNGYHRDWDSKLFDYGKYEVLKFLLSNVRWWVEEYNIDGFRYDGVTCIIYKHHGNLIRY
jgi:1,4-alpha-glucan branching enzyme